MRVPIAQKLFYMMAQPAALSPLGLVDVLEWAATALNRVDRASFFNAFEEDRAVQYFYEPFLEAFDPALRKELGVWYTPPEIVQYMVARIDKVLQEELDVPDGLADPNVYVLDPCCGTGSYLVEVLRSIHSTLQESRDDALVASDVKTAALSRIFGFEILPAPFVVAHLQLGLFLQNLGAPPADVESERAGVYLTNALTGWEPLDPEQEKAFQTVLTGFPELLEERDSAREVKTERPILVILGNPPYNGFAGTSPAEEEGLAEPYKRGLKKWGITKNYLDDLYVRFFRLAERRIAEQTGRGVVAFITNFSYLDDPSFVVMRQRFLTEFDCLWFDNMNGDSRETGKRTPDGKPDPSVFSTEYNRAGIKLGTAVSVLVRKSERDDEPLVRYQEFWGVAKRANLADSLSVTDFDSQYQTVHPEEDSRYSFRPETLASGYRTWPLLVDLSEIDPMLGLNENRQQALHDTTRNALRCRMESYYDPAVSLEQIRDIHPGLATNAASFDAQATRQRLLKDSGFEKDRIVRFWFKPFDLRWAYVETIGNLWNRARPLLLGQARTGNGFLLARRHTPSVDDGSAMFFSHHIADQHVLQTDAYFIPVRLWRHGNKQASGSQSSFLGREEASATATANLSAAARTYLASLGIIQPDEYATASLMWMHALAVGYSPVYLEENRDGIRQDWPRIPLPATREGLGRSAALGEQVAALLDNDDDVQGVTSGSIRPELRIIGSISRVGGGQLLPSDLALTAGWGHRGQNNVVMPGRGKAVERDYTLEERQAVEAGAAKLGLSLEEALARLGERTCDVYLNEVAYWGSVPRSVWDYVIGGYQVIKKWLSYREQKVFGHPLNVGEVREVTNMARRIAAILLLTPELDSNYFACKDESYMWRKS